MTFSKINILKKEKNVFGTFAHMIIHAKKQVSMTKNVACIPRTGKQTDRMTGNDIQTDRENEN